jgi:glycosyltransferase involved in cell wall biosynthesis
LLPEVHAVLVGDALFPGDRPYAESLRQRAQVLQVQDRVHFVGFQENIPLWMRMVDVVAHTSTAPEPFGRVIVEGMLAKRPVVAAAAGGAQEIIQNGNGTSVPPGDVNSLANILHRLLASPDDAERLARVGHRTARRRFSTARMIRGIRSAVESVLSGSGGRQASVPPHSGVCDYP